MRGPQWPSGFASVAFNHMLSSLCGLDSQCDNAEDCPICPQTLNFDFETTLSINF